MTTSSVNQREILGVSPLKGTRFCEILAKQNALDKRGFKGWVFCAGMLFKSRDKWWGAHGKRGRPHEGVDFCFYRDREDRLWRLNETTRIPVMADGRVAGIIPDFLGKSVIVKHPCHRGRRGELVSIYAHTKPKDNIDVGTAVTEGQLIATLAPAGGPKTGTGPHLHLSLGWAKNGYSWESFDWETIGTSDTLQLLDPLQAMDCRYFALEAAERDDVLG